MSASKNDLMRAIGIAYVEAMYSGGVPAFFTGLAAACDETTKTKLRNILGESSDDVQDQGCTPGEQWWRRKLMQADEATWKTEVPGKELLREFSESVGLGEKRSVGALETMLHRACRDVTSIDKQIAWNMNPKGERISYGPFTKHYQIPTLKEARGLWDIAYGAEDWPEGSTCDSAQEG